MTTTAPQVDARVDVDPSGDAVQARFAVKLPTPKLPTPALSLDEVRKPVYAYVGAADLALEQVKSLPGAVKALPAQVRDLRSEVESRVSKAQGQASELYAALAVRGERLVTSIRRQPATQAAVAEGKEAVKKAEAAAVAAAKSARAGGKAAEDAAAKIG